MRDGSYFYPRSPCGERRDDGRDSLIERMISIHALLAESDCSCCSGWLLAPYFYPRSPCGERLPLSGVLCGLIIFLSTLSLRRATDTSSLMQCQARFLSTLSLRRATSMAALRQALPAISIHALLAESDNRYGRPIDVQFVFLSTLSLRRATCILTIITCTVSFLSTLSLRRATKSLLTRVVSSADFYPRSPCGERLVQARHLGNIINFYPRSPCGERHQCEAGPHWTADFYPRSPCGERQGARPPYEI